MQNVRGKILNLGATRYFPMDEAGNAASGFATAVDWSASLVNASYTLAPKAGRQGVGRIGTRGTSFYFDDTDESVNCGSASDIDNLGPFTFNGWMQCDSVPTRMLTKGTVIKCVILNTGLLRMLIGYSSTNLRADSTDAIPTDGRWVMVTFTWDDSVNASGVGLYFDGVKQTNTNTRNAVGSQTNDAANTFWLASENNTTAFHDGRMCEVSVFDTELTEADVHGLYAAYRRDDIPRRTVL